MKKNSNTTQKFSRNIMLQCCCRRANIKTPAMVRRPNDHLSTELPSIASDAPGMVIPQIWSQIPTGREAAIAYHRKGIRIAQDNWLFLSRSLRKTNKINMLHNNRAILGGIIVLYRNIKQLLLYRCCQICFINMYSFNKSFETKCHKKLD